MGVWGRTAVIGLAVVAIALSTGCADEPLNRLVPQIVVQPEQLNFGARPVDRDSEAWLSVGNRGEALLEVLEIEVEQPVGPGEFFLGAKPRFLQPQEQVLVEIFFRPFSPQELVQSTLLVRSTDPVQPQLEIPLAGTGGLPEIRVEPRRIDFGLVQEGAPAYTVVTLENAGQDVLTITGLVWTSTSVDLRLDLSSWRLPSRLEPGEARAVPVRYAPRDVGADHGHVRIESTAGREPEVRVDVRGAANLAPRAVAYLCRYRPGVPGCAATDRRKMIGGAAFDALALDGRTSFDPEGASVTRFEWRLVNHPPGVAPGTESRATTRVEISTAGHYTFRLVVTDDRGLESFDTPQSRVQIRPRDVEVALTWDIDTDVDLHFVRDGGNVGNYGNRVAGTSTGSDCSAFNRAPNWADLSTSADDPQLDRDVVSGRGPEVVSLDFPEPARPYRAFVHYCDSRNRNVNANVWLEVRSRGELVGRIPLGQGSRRMLPDELWEAASISWDELQQRARVMAVDGPVISDSGLCRVP